jgi:hypothetical protein
VCRAAADDLADRLARHAAAHRLALLAHSFSAGTLVSSVGKLLDRGISALMGGDAKPAPAPAHSRSSSSGFGPEAHAHAHAQPGAPYRSPTKGRAAGGPMGRPSSQQRAHDFGGGGGAASSPPPPHYQPQLQQPQAAAAEPAPTPKLLSTFMSGVSSLKNMVAPPPVSGPATTPPGELENAFYYDNELKQWRQRGVEPPPPPPAAAPPPTVPTWQAQSAAAAGPSPVQPAGVGRYVNSFGGTPPPARAAPAGGPPSFAPPPPFGGGAAFVAGPHAGFGAPPQQIFTSQQVFMPVPPAPVHAVPSIPDGMSEVEL